MTQRRIGIDLGGTKIEGIVLDGKGKESARKRISTPRDDYLGTVAAVRDLALELEAQTGGPGASVGVGMPGALSPATGLVKNANSTWLIGHPLDRDLAEALARPVRVANDANCLAVSEATDGAAQGAEMVFAVILGTGVGGGLAIGGRCHAGAQAIAGEWGHNPLPWPGREEYPGPPCYCGKQGCIETYLSGPGLEADHAAGTGERRTGRDIVAAATRGNPGASATLERYVDRLARGLASVINILDPDAIVLGGGVSNAERLYTALPERLGRYVFSDSCTTPVRRSLHGDSSGVRGAAWLWPPLDRP